MNLLQMICHLPRAIWEARHYDPHVKDEKLHELARFSYQLCTEWFGVPPDHVRGYKLIYDVRNRCILPPFVKASYLIALKKGYAEPQYASIIAHEMYHRVTMPRPGIHRIRWVDEMIAYGVERHAVPELGYADYAEYMHKSFLERPDNLNVHIIKEFYMKGAPSGMDIEACKLQLDISGIALGVQLEALVGWKEICKIVGCLTWEDWLTNLVPEIREKVVALLDL